MRPNFFVLSSSELVKAYNDMALEAATLEMHAPPVKRFATRDAGLRRCEALYRALCEKKGEEYEAPSAAAQEMSSDVSPSSEGSISSDIIPKRVKGKKPAKAKNPIKEKKPKKEPKPQVRSIKSEIVEACKVSGGTNRARALDYLSARFGKQCMTSQIMTIVYGSAAEETSTAAFYTVMKGLVRDITNSKCKYEIKRIKDEKGNISYGLYRKNGNGK